MQTIRVMNKRAKKFPDGAVVIDTTSNSSNWSAALSPFHVGPIKLYGGRTATCLENAWQFCKVYLQHTDINCNPTLDYWDWAEAGWVAPAKRYPMGRGARPLYSLWDNQRHDYISARRNIYAPLYAKYVVLEPAYTKLQTMLDNCASHDVQLVLLDYDGYDVGPITKDNAAEKLKEVLENPAKKMGHAFVIAGLLLNERFWE